MNKRNIALTMAALALVIALPAITRAEEGHDEADTQKSAREQLRMENREADATKKRELSAISTSTRIIKNLKPEEVKNAIKEVRSDIKDARKTATSSQIRKELKRVEKFEIFKIQHARLVRQLNLAVDNLKQIRDRLASRITKAEQSGRNMNEAKNLLSVADTKITAARQAIVTLSTYIPTATSTATSTEPTASTTVDLQKPRQIGEAAIKAVKDAHKALVDVVRSIAKNMGFRTGQATTTTPTNSPSPTATTTATTTTP